MSGKGQHGPGAADGTAIDRIRLRASALPSQHTHGVTFSRRRYGRARVMLVASCASLLCAFTFGWMWAAPVWALAVFGAFYNLCAIADSSVYSTALADVVPANRLGAAFSVRSVMGFGAGAVSAWVFGVALDWGRSHLAFRGDALLLALCTVGLGVLVGHG